MTAIFITFHSQYVYMDNNNEDVLLTKKYVDTWNSGGNLIIQNKASN